MRRRPAPAVTRSKARARLRGSLGRPVLVVKTSPVGYIRLENPPDPVRVRAAFVSDTDIAAMAGYLAEAV